MEAQITDPSAPYYDAYQAAIFAETGTTTLNQEQPQGEDWQIYWIDYCSEPNHHDYKFAKQNELTFLSGLYKH